MQIKIIIPLTEPLSLPIAYHHIQQSFLYRLMDKDGVSPLHDGGFNYEKRKYKLFTFGPFEGKYAVKDGRILFSDRIGMEFRCVDESIANCMVDNIKNGGITIGRNLYTDISVNKFDHHVKSDNVVVRMLSPITVRETDADTNKTQYYFPGEEAFIDAVVQNFRRKYSAYTGSDIDPGMEFEVLDVRPKDKYLTRYKGFIIEGYKGLYRIKALPDHIDFLYNCGIGSKNSQGFGMFEIVQG